MKRRTAVAVTLLVLSAVFGCSSEKRELDTSYDPVITPGNFSRSTELTNLYFPYAAGKTYVYEGRAEEGMQRNEVRVMPTRKTILGIECVVVNDRAYLNGTLIESAEDWYAQDNAGNVWYMGEKVDNFDNSGKLRDHEGSWEAGVDGAKPGIAMQADPKAGQKYRQEYYFGEAEDQAEIVQIGLTIATPLRSFDNVLKTRETNPLEEGVVEFKYYAPGVGLIKEENPEEEEELVLVRIQE